MRLHGLAAFAVLFAFGALAAAHIPQGWRLSHRVRWPQQRAVRGGAVRPRGLLALTGYLLYYFAPDAVRPALGWLHSALGAAMSDPGPRPSASRASGACATAPDAGRPRPIARTKRPSADAGRREGIQMRENLIRMCKAVPGAARPCHEPIATLLPPPARRRRPRRRLRAWSRRRPRSTRSRCAGSASSASCPASRCSCCAAARAGASRWRW